MNQPVEEQMPLYRSDQDGTCSVVLSASGTVHSFFITAHQIPKPQKKVEEFP